MYIFGKAASAATAAAVIAAGLAIAVPAPATAATQTFTQTQDFAFGDMYQEAFGGQIQILDASVQAPRAALQYPSSTNNDVFGIVGTVTHVKLAINGFDHEAPRDVDIMLVAPDGTRSLVMSDVGGANPVNDVNLVFDDNASGSLNFDATVTSGTYRPSNDSGGDYFPGPAPSADGVGTSFEVFEGINPTGKWHLYVVDDLNVYTGGIDSWKLFVTTGSTFPSQLDVSGVQGAVTDVDVQLNIDHSRFSDLDALLVGPQGQQVTLFSDAGGPGAIGGSVPLVFDGDASSGVPDPLDANGPYRPTDVVEPAKPDSYGPAVTPDGNTDLSVLDGTDVNGKWSLFVVDDTAVYSGFVYEWSLRFTTPDPVSPTPAADTRNPRVETASPGPRQKGVARGANVVATLDEKLDPASVKASTAYLLRKGSTRRVPAKVSWRAGTWRIVIDPRNRLRARTTYVVVVTTRVTDLAGNRLDQNRARTGLQRLTYRFTTR